MDIDEFWRIIDQSLEAGVADRREQTAFVQNALHELPESDVCDFAKHIEAVVRRAMSREILVAGYILTGETGAEDFCSWLVSRGRRVYDSVVNDPDSLADSVEPSDAERYLLEDPRHFLRVAHFVLGDCRGEPPAFPVEIFFPYGETVDHRDYAALARRYPRLWEMFGDRAIRRARDETAEILRRSEQRCVDTGVRWMDYSGALPILIPERCLPYWSGFYELMEDGDDGAYSDLELPDGRRFMMCTDSDFDDPVTDYDRLCVPRDWTSGHRTYAVGPGSILVIDEYRGGSIGWWSEQSMLLEGARNLPDLSKVREADWGEPVLWTVPDSRVLLMNSCLHGLQDFTDEPDCEELTFERGEYRVDSHHAQDGSDVKIYRFTRL